MKSVVIPVTVDEIRLSNLYKDNQEMVEELKFEGDFRWIHFVVDIDMADYKFENIRVTDEKLPKFLQNLNKKSLLKLIEYCPEVCFAIPSERCNDEMMSRIEDSIIRGMCSRTKLGLAGSKDVNMSEDIAVLKPLKEWKRSEYEKHLTPYGRLMTAIEEFKDNK